MSYEEKDVFEFLEEWRTSAEVQEKFGMNSTQWFKLNRWMMKGGFIERCSTIINNKTNRVYMYRVIKEK